MKYTEESDKVSYSLGLSIASNLIASGVRTINTPAFIDAIETAYAGKQPEISPDEANKILQGFFQKLQNERGSAAKKAGEKFLADNKQQPGVVTLPSGLQYKIISQGSGAVPKATDTVRCHWTEPLACRPAFEPAVLDSATLYVPAGTKAAYEATAPWGGFKNIVEKNYSSITSTQSSAPSVTVIDGTIVIEGETDMAQPVEVYSTGGQCVHRGAGTRIEGLPHGVYVVKVGQGTAKVVL